MVLKFDGIIDLQPEFSFVCGAGSQCCACKSPIPGRAGKSAKKLLDRERPFSLGLAGSLSFFVPPPSRAFRYARGHLHVSRFARRTKKKERLHVVSQRATHLKGEAL